MAFSFIENSTDIQEMFKRVTEQSTAYFEERLSCIGILGKVWMKFVYLSQIKLKCSCHQISKLPRCIY